MNDTVLKNNFLLNIHFETGDASCRYYEVLVVLHTVKEHLPYETVSRIETEIRDVLMSEEDDDYEGIVEIALNRLSALDWNYFKYSVDNVVGVVDIFID